MFTLPPTIRTTIHFWKMDFDIDMISLFVPPKLNKKLYFCDLVLGCLHGSSVTESVSLANYAN